MKKCFLMLAMGLVVLLPGQVRATGEYSLIVAPARYSVMQVMFDVINRSSAVLVSYQGEASTANPALHVWNGSVWNPLGVHDLRELSFLQRTPTRAILVGDDALLPASVRDSLAWLPEVIYVRELGTAPMLNDLGRIFKWSSREWRWYARRYNLDLEDEAEPARRQSWYDQQGPKRQPAAHRAVAPAPVGTVPGAIVPDVVAPVPVVEPPPALERPRDMPPAPVIEAPAPTPTKSEIDSLIETLEQDRASTPAPAATSFPIK